MVDFAFLRQRGIELLQQISWESWTDYNLHDPGVTILEALCYALTDLSYRTEFPMEHLLADKEDKIRLHHNAFFTREEILTTNPVSVNDCRKFILDRMGQLHNVWLEPFMSGFSFGTMHGLYTLKVQVKKELSANLTPEWTSNLRREVRSCFVSARNLCDDLIKNLTILRPVDIRIQAEVIITGDQPESILAYIYRDLEATINPPVRYYTEKELLDKGCQVEDIHAGPRLRKGFIPDEELQPRKLIIDPAELMKAITQVPGVDYVRSLTIITPEGRTDRMPYRLPEDTYPYFREDPGESPIRLLRGKYEVSIRNSVFNDIWTRVKEAARRNIEPVMDLQASSGIRHGQHRDVMFYHSIQHLFPTVYGIGPDGPGNNPSPERMGQVRQLKGYLLVFEQLLADYLAQLANLSEFFSLDNSGHTYYTQPLYQVPDIRPLLKDSYAQALTESAETKEEYLERRNAVLDHLLARFNQRPSDYPVRLYTQLYATPDTQQKEEEVIEWKSALLKNIAGISYNRARGFNYLAKEGFDNGGFYEKMMALLYIKPATGPLTERTTLSITSTEHITSRITSSEHTTPRISHRSMTFFRLGLDTDNYTIRQDTNGQGWLILFKEPAETSPQVISRHPDKTAAIAAQQQIIEQLREISIQSEGFYIIEHVLLRPAVDTQSFGFRFLTTGKEVLLRHNRWTSFEEREQILKDILRAAAQAPVPMVPDQPDTTISEWGVKNLGGRCRIRLGRHKDFGFLSDPADLEPWIWQETAPDFEHIRQQLLFFSENRLQFYPRFEMLVKGLDDNPVAEEFFDFNITVLLPAWPARFQDPNFRAFAMDLFRQHTPAHIRLSFQWLNVSRMKEFEDLYPNWITAIKDQDDLEPRRHWSEHIIHFLKRGIY